MDARCARIGFDPLAAQLQALGGGLCFDREFAVWSRALMEDFRAGRFRPVLSELLAAELERAPGPVRAIYAELLAVAAAPQAITSEVRELADHYAARRILPPRFRNNLLHVALATVADADVVASWNFRHIVRFDKIRVFNAVNLEAGTSRWPSTPRGR